MIINRENIRAIKENKKLPFPYVVQLGLTDVCPFNCPQCYKGEIRHTHMDFDKLKDLVTYCYNNGTRIFVLNGGEPMLYYKMNELLAFLNTFNIRVNCFTSGYGMTNDIIDLWNFDNNRLCLSLNGSTEKINGLTRQGYDVTINAMKKLHELKKHYGINWVARHDNLMDISDLVNLCEKNAVKYMYINSEKLTGAGRLMSPLSKEDYVFLSNFITNYLGDIEIIIESCFPTLNILLQKSDVANYFMGCFVGKFGCHVDMNFRYSPCTHLECYEMYESIRDYWDKSAILSRLSNNHYDDCNKCWHHSRCNRCRVWDEEVNPPISPAYPICPVFLSDTKQVRHG